MNIIIYKTLDGKEPFVEWLFSLRDKALRHRIEARIERLKNGNYGDHKRFHGIIEIRMDFGKGYRIYCGEEGNKVIVLLAGGDKSSQEKDIEEALVYWREYHG